MSVFGDALTEGNQADHLTAILPLYIRCYTIIRSRFFSAGNERWRSPLAKETSGYHVIRAIDRALPVYVVPNMTPCIQSCEGIGDHQPFMRIPMDLEPHQAT